MALCVEMLISGNLAKDDAEPRAKLQAVLDNGKAAEILVAWLRRRKARPISSKIMRSTCRRQCSAKRYMLIPKVLSALWIPVRWEWRLFPVGGGRRQASDTIDYSVGFSDMARLGDSVDGQRPLAVIHAKDEASWQEAAESGQSGN